MPNNTPLDKLIKSVKNNLGSSHRKSKVCSWIYYSVEIMDIDGITGGFNFQNTWTSGWIAGSNMAMGSIDR